MHALVHNSDWINFIELISGNIFFRLLDYAADYIQLTYEAFIRVIGVG